MVKKGVLSIVLTLILSLWALPALAVSGNTPPEFNPICWKQKECTDARQLLLRKNNTTLTDVEKKQIGEGWVEDPIQCPGEGWGKCLPANVTVTAISINGQTRFLHIGTYIQTVYKFVLTIAGILAAAMMVIAGVQWVTSGGNAESISSAKTRIVNALVGMFLAYTSFFILNTIDPALINLRLPQVYLIKPQNAVAELCATAASSTTFVFAADTKDQQTPIDTSKTPDFDKSGVSYTDLMTTDKGFCGHRFFMKDAGAITCFSSYCAPEGEYAQTCVKLPLPTDRNKTAYKCQRGNISGIVVNSQILGGNMINPLSDTLWNNPPIWVSAFPNWTTSNNVKMVCGNGYVGDVGSMIEVTNVDDRSQRYVLSIKNSELDGVIQNTIGSTVTHNTVADSFWIGLGAVKVLSNSLKSWPNSCSGGVRGFVLNFAFNYTALHLNSAEEHAIGLNGVDLGDIDFFKTFNQKIPDSYFIPPSQVKNGIIVNVDTANVHNMNSDRGFWDGSIDIKSSKHKLYYDYLLTQ